MPDTSDDVFIIDKELMYSMIETIRGTLNMSEIAEIMAKENPHLFIKAAKQLQVDHNKTQKGMLKGLGDSVFYKDTRLLNKMGLGDK